MTEPADDTFPVSSGQERLLLLDQVDPTGVQYAIVDSAITGPGLDPARFADCVRTVVARHEALRTTFTWERTGVVQRVHEVLDPEVSQHTDVAEDDLPGLIDRLARRPFDLERGPLLRVLLAALEDGRWAVVVSVHHVVADGLSMNIVFAELAALYSGKNLPEVPEVQYADYALWQREQEDSAAGMASLEFWTRLLRGAPELLALPWDRRRPEMQCPDGDSYRFRIETDLFSRATAVARQHRVTPFSLFQAAYAVLLSRLSGQDDLVLGFPAGGRERPELENVVGFFVNTVPLRVSVPQDHSFASLLREAADATAAASAHQSVPLEKIISAVVPRREPAWHPLFQVLFSWDESAGLSGLGDLSVTRRPVHLPIAKFDLSLILSPADGGLDAAFEFRTDLLDRATAARWAECFTVLLDRLLSTPDRPVGEPSLLSDAEHARVLALGTGPVVAGTELSLPQLWAASVARCPDAPAVVHGERVWTYAELDERSALLAGQLREQGVGPGSRVGISLDRSPELCAAVLAVLRTGAAYVPLDPTYPATRLEFMVADAGVSLILDNSLPDSGTPLEQSTVDPDSLAYVIYTSGSTGVPKGVRVTHRSVANLSVAQGEVFGIGQDDRVAQFASLSFDVSVAEMWITWVRGAALVMLDADRRIGPPLAETLREGKVTVLVGPPTALASLDPVAHPELRLVVSTGEPCPPSVVDAWGEGRRLVNAYGPTEATVWATATDLVPGGELGIGTALPNASVHVMDKAGRLVPLGVTGEVYIGGLGVADGYLDRPELTAERFTSGRYRTGDLGLMRPNGSVVLLGRADDQIKLHGFRIELGEVEALLAGHPAVTAAVAAVTADDGPARLVGYVVTADGKVPSGLRDWVAERAPRHLVPSAFRTITEVPLSPAGKVDRRALPVPSLDRPELGTTFVAPRTMLERKLADTWADALRLDRVGLHDNFFELGGNSLLLMRIYQELREVAEIPSLRITDLFKYPTVASLARGVARQQAGTAGGSSTRRRVTALARRRERQS